MLQQRRRLPGSSTMVPLWLNMRHDSGMDLSTVQRALFLKTREVLMAAGKFVIT